MTKPKGVFKKRKFHRNRYTQDAASCADVLNSVNIELSNVPAVINVSATPTSASKRKLEHSEVEFIEKESSVNNVGYVLVDLDMLSTFLCESVCCKTCGELISVHEDISARIGVVSKLVIYCNSCKSNKSFMTSRKCKDELFESNVRLFYGMRCIGKGLTAAQILCASLNLPNPPAKFNKYTDVVGECITSVANASMKAAVEEAVEINDNKRDISVAVDGTWQKRGYKSKNSVATVTSVDTGKVLDFEVLTKHCHQCTAFSKGKKSTGNHKCAVNYEGTSGGMEAAAVVSIFKRSQEERKVCYIEYLGDGDSKAYKCVVECQPYGEKEVRKIECVGHVQKRMGTRLRKLRQSLGKTKLSDGKTIKNKGRLTDKIIDDLQHYYGNAIRSNSDDLDGMKRGVWATYFHKLSSDESPIHGLCPPGQDSWCKYRKAQAMGTEHEFRHRNNIPAAVMEAIKPIYRELAHPNLLAKCLHGRTQNPNESFNNVIWTRIPKNVFVGAKTLRLGVSDAVITYNAGNIGRIKVLEQLGINPGVNTLQAFHRMDKLRISKAQRAAEQMTAEARGRRKRKLLSSQGEQEEDSDNADYGPGCF